MDLHAVRRLEPFALLAKQESRIDGGVWDSITRRQLEDQFEKDSTYIGDVADMLSSDGQTLPWIQRKVQASS